MTAVLAAVGLVIITGALAGAMVWGYFGHYWRELRRLTKEDVTNWLDDR